MIAAGTTVRRAHVRAPDADAGRHVSRVLAGASLHPRGLPPAAVLCVRRLGDPLPGRLALGELAPPPEWEAAVADALERERRGAARPALGPVPAGATAILFADRAELLACLAADWLSGELALRWWWAGLVDLTLPDREAVAAAWREQPRYVPAAVELLAARGLDVAFAAALGEDEAASLAEATAIEHGRPELAAPIAARAGSRTANTPDVAAAREAARAAASASPARPATPAAPLPACPGELTAAPVVERREDPPPAVAAPSSDAAPPLVDASPPALADAREIAAVPVAPPEPQEITSAPVWAPAPAPVRSRPRASEPEPAAPPAPVEAPPAERLLAVARALRNAPTAPLASERPGPAHVPQPAPSPPPERPASGERTAAAPAETPAPATAGAPPAMPPDVDTELSLSAAAAKQPVASEPAEVIATAFGGLFFLVNAGLHLELIADFTNPRATGLDPWDFIALAGRELVDEPDPIWSLLAELAGRAEDEPPGHAFDPGPWRMPPAWLEPWHAEPAPADAGRARAWTYSTARGRLRVLHPAGFLVVDEALEGRTATGALAAYGSPPARRGRVADVGGRGAPARRWARLLAAYLRPRLALALGVDDAVELLLRRPARVHVTAAHVDVELELATHPLEIRLAGLDRDPGWLPASTRRLAFRFR